MLDYGFRGFFHIQKDLEEMSDAPSQIVKTVLNETIRRCDILLSHIANLEHHLDIETLSQQTGKRLQELRGALLDIRNDDGIENPRILPNFVIKLSNVLESLDEIQDGPMTALLGRNTLDQKMRCAVQHLLGQIKYPYDLPVVSSSGRIHFASLPSWNLLFAPPSTEHMLTSVPDLLHEIGHIVWHRNPQFEQALFAPIHESIEGQIEDATIRSRRALVSHLRQLELQWQYWLREVFCDIFAAFVSGPAYAYSHLRYCVESMSILFSPGNLKEVSCPSDHPSDAARMEVIMELLEKSGLAAEHKILSAQWKSLVKALRIAEPTEHRILYPVSVISQILNESVRLINRLGIRSFSLGLLAENDDLISLTNQAWTRTSLNDATYANWEASTFGSLLARLDFSS